MAHVAARQGARDARSIDAERVDSRWRALAIDRSWLLPLMAIFVVKQFLLLAMIGPFSGHDEVDHFWYIARLGAGHGLGVVGEVVLPAEADPYRAYVANYPSNAEVIQPPLYHLLLAPIERLIPGSPVNELYVLRSFSIIVGALVVWLAYLTGRVLFPDSPLVRAGVPIFVALQPQLSFEAAIINHDILLILLVSMSLYLALLGVRDGFSKRHLLLLGLVGGAGLWTKVSFGLILPVVAVAVAYAWWDRREPLRGLAADLARSIGLSLLLICPWFVRSLWLYGDPTGAARLREIPTFGDQAQRYPEMLGSMTFWRQMLEDLWGNYGWRQIPFDPVMFRVIWIVWGAALLGLVPLLLRGGILRRGNRSVFSAFQRRGLVLLLLALLLLVFGVLYVGTLQFTQARFAFPGMIAFAVFTTLGISGWLPERSRTAALPVLFLLLVVLNTIVTLRFILPFYYGSGGTLGP